MISLFKRTGMVIEKIEDFLNTVDESQLVFSRGISAYLKSDGQAFADAIARVAELEGQADLLKREIENGLYKYSLIPEYRGDVVQIISKIDDLIDNAKESLFQFEVEQPEIPGELHDDYLELTRTSVKAVETVILSTKAVFNDIKSMKNIIHRVYFYEKEADKISNELKKKVFKKKTGLELSHKQHLRHFASHIENLSNIAEEIADYLTIFSIKRSI